MKIKDNLKSNALKTILNKNLLNIGTIEELTIDTKEHKLFASFVIEELLPTKFSISATYEKPFSNIIRLNDVHTSHKFIQALLEKESMGENALEYILPVKWLDNL